MRRTPKIVRKVSGYNLAGLLPGARRQEPGDRKTELNGAASPLSPVSRHLSPNLVPLLVGSEGTLAVVAEAELALVPRPKHRGLLVPQFDSLAAALDALAMCLELWPSAVELMDKMLIDLARQQRGLKDTMAAVRGRPEALLMVEFSSDDPADVSYRVHELQRRLGPAVGLLAAVPALDAATRDPLWALRSSAVPLLYGMPGDRASRSRSAKTARSRRSDCPSSRPASARSSTATAPTVRSTVTPRSAACTSARC